MFPRALVYLRFPDIFKGSWFCFSPGHLFHYWRKTKTFSEQKLPTDGTEGWKSINSWDALRIRSTKGRPQIWDWCWSERLRATFIKQKFWRNPRLDENEINISVIFQSVTANLAVAHFFPPSSILIYTFNQSIYLFPMSFMGFLRSLLSFLSPLPPALSSVSICSCLPPPFSPCHCCL